MATLVNGRIINRFALSSTSVIEFPAVDTVGKGGEPKTLYCSFTLDVDIPEDGWGAVLKELDLLGTESVKVRYPKTEHLAGALKWRLAKKPWHTGNSLASALREMMLTEEERTARDNAILAKEETETERLKALALADQAKAAADAAALAEKDRKAQENAKAETERLDALAEKERKKAEALAEKERKKAEALAEKERKKAEALAKKNGKTAAV